MSKTISTTFNISIPSQNLSSGDQLTFRFRLGSSSGLNGNFTASFNDVGSLKVSSLAASTGYNALQIQNVNQAFDSASIATSTNEIILSQGLTNFYGGNYIFVPNPLTGSQDSLYANAANYGDVDYNFVINPFDIILVYLSDGTYLETRVLNVYKSSNKLHIQIDTQLSATLKKELANQTYQQFLVLSRQQDETNIILSFIRRDGKTSYGFIIPEDISSEVLANIDTITKEVKQKLLSDQSVISDISGGSF